MFPFEFYFSTDFTEKHVSDIIQYSDITVFQFFIAVRSNALLEPQSRKPQVAVLRVFSPSFISTKSHYYPLIQLLISEPRGHRDVSRNNEAVSTLDRATYSRVISGNRIFSGLSRLFARQRSFPAERKFTKEFLAF